MVQETIDCSRCAISVLFDEKMEKCQQNQLSFMGRVSCTKSLNKYVELVKKLKESVKRCAVLKADNTLNAQRDKAVSTIRCLTHFYGCNPATYATAVSCLDRFLSRVKVQPKYYSCLATSCFYLSNKFHDEDEDIPSATQLSNLMQHAWKSSDLKRMETVIMQKLDWKLWVETCPSLLETLCDIIQIFTSTRVLGHSFLAELVKKFEICINYTSCAVYSTASLAFSLLLHGLEEEGLLNEINQFVLNLHSICQVSDAEFYECHAMVSKVLSSYKNHPKHHPPCLPTPKPFPRPNLISRPSLYGDSELPAIEENPSMELALSETESKCLVQCATQKLVQGGHSWSTCILPQKCTICSLE